MAVMGNGVEGTEEVGEVGEGGGLEATRFSVEDAVDSAPSR